MPKNVETLQNVAQYIVDGMRTLRPSEKVAAKNPDRALTVIGKAFYQRNADGSRGEKLTFTSKSITIEMALHPATVIDKVNGVLVLPAGERGRKASAGLEQEDIDTYLASLREQASNTDAPSDETVATA